MHKDAKNVKNKIIYIFIPHISSSREVVGGGDVRLLGMLYAIHRLNNTLAFNHQLNYRFKVILLTDKYYYEALRRLSEKSGILSNKDFEALIDKVGLINFPRYDL